MTRITLILALIITSIPTVFLPQSLSARSKNYEVDCRKVKRSKRKYCYRQQQRLQAEKGKRHRDVDEHARRQSVKVDCATHAANFLTGQVRALPSLLESAGVYSYKRTLNAARHINVSSDAKCSRWAKRYFFSNVKKCERWLDRNGVNLMKNGRPWNALRQEYVRGAPRYCGF